MFENKAEVRETMLLLVSVSAIRNMLKDPVGLLLFGADARAAIEDDKIVVYMQDGSKHILSTDYISRL